MYTITSKNKEVYLFNKTKLYLTYNKVVNAMENDKKVMNNSSWKLILFSGTKYFQVNFKF